MAGKSSWPTLVGLFAVLVAACALSLLAGTVWVPFDQMPESRIMKVRAARTLLAVVAGAGLSVSGVVFQALFRNPLAEPYILGVSSGAGLGAAVAIVLNLVAISIWAIPAAAFVGALATILLVYALARGPTAATSVNSLLLSGVMVGAIFSSLLIFIVSFSSSDHLRSVVAWLLGNLQILDWPLERAVTMVVAAGLMITLVFARDLNVITLGEEPAAHLGLNVERTKVLFLMLASLMTGATVAACGLIGFVGLIVPHSVRFVLGPDHRRLIPATAIAGAAFLVLADSFARTITSRDIPIGVVTALLGGPFFFFLLRRRKRASWG